MIEASTLTDTQRLAIRLELAKAIGWRITTLPGWQMAWLSPDETTQDEPPDPFTSAADKDALVGWIACDWPRWKNFFKELCFMVIPRMMKSPEYLARTSETDDGTIGPSQAEWAFALMTAPLEAITLAAAAALGITAPPPEAAPPPALPEAQRRE